MNVVAGSFTQLPAYTDIVAVLQPQQRRGENISEVLVTQGTVGGHLK